MSAEWAGKTDLIKGLFNLIRILIFFMICYNIKDMDLNIVGQYKYIARERARLKKLVAGINRRFPLLKNQLKHAYDIKIARNQKKKIPLEKVIHELGL